VECRSSKVLKARPESRSRIDCRCFRERSTNRSEVERGGQEVMHRVLNPALDVANGASGVPLIPGPVQRLGGGAELDEQVVAEVRGFGLAALFLTQPNESGRGS
jgi:hypothetical protein